MYNTDSLFCISRIKSTYEFMSKVEKAIADYIIASPAAIPKLSASELAEETGTSPASIVRFCRKLGFSGFSEMKMNLSRSELANTEQDLLSISPGDPPAVIRQKVLTFNKQAIDGLDSTLRDEAVSQAADLIASARRILIMGEGGSGSTARTAFDVFLKLSLPCEYVSDPFFELMVIDQLTDKDVILCICNSARSRGMIENLQKASAQGIPTIGIIGLPNSPMSKYLTVEITTNLFTSELFSDLIASRICEISALSVLYSILALQRSADHLVKNQSDILNVKRVHWNEKT